MLRKKTTKSQKKLQYKFYATATAIPKEDWNKVLGEKNIFLSIPYLIVLENTLKKTISFQYLIFYLNQIPVAIALTQRITLDTGTLQYQNFPCHISDTLGNKILRNLELKVLVCGNLFACGQHGFLHTDQLTSQEAFLELAQALQSLRNQETTEKPSLILLKEFWPSAFEDSAILLDKEYRSFEIDVNMVLPIAPDWHSFEDYLASLKTKFRNRAKNVFKKSAAVVVQNFLPTDIERYQTEINRLYRSVMENADFKIEKLNTHTFQGFKEALQERFVFKGYFLDHTLIGFTTAFVLQDAIEANHIGLDYGYNKSHALYQRMLYDYTQLAISAKVADLRLGRTAELIKSSLGAQAVPMKLYVRHGHAISNTLLKPLVEMITPSPYELRNPFRQNPN